MGRCVATSVTVAGLAAADASVSPADTAPAKAGRAKFSVLVGATGAESTRPERTLVKPSAVARAKLTLSNITTVAAGLLTLCGASAALAACAPDSVDLRWPGGQARFTVEVADTPGLREEGLMFRDSMASSEAMIFVYPAPQHVHFWMKNTLIPLDMVFADPTGRVTAVHSNAIPGDLTPIDGGEGVSYVLEINGGLAARLGIAPGADLRAALIDQGKAKWRCTE